MMPTENILRFYAAEFERMGVAPQRGGTPLQHCAWMIQEITLTHNPMPGKVTDIEKVNRWIGFVQGVLWTQEVYTIDEMRQHVINSKGVSSGAV